MSQSGHYSAQDERTHTIWDMIQTNWTANNSVSIDELDALRVVNQEHRSRFSVAYIQQRNWDLEDMPNDPIIYQHVRSVVVRWFGDARLLKLVALRRIETYCELPDLSALVHLRQVKLHTRYFDGSAFPQATHLEFGPELNIDLGSRIFPSVTHFTCGTSFNSQFYSRNFPNLTHLKFGAAFNIALHDVFPNVVDLEFGATFNQPFTLNAFPNLQRLKMGASYDVEIGYAGECTNITHLEIGPVFSGRLYRRLFPALTHLTLFDSGNFFYFDFDDFAGVVVNRIETLAITTSRVKSYHELRAEYALSME